MKQEEEFKKIIIARLEILPQNRRISIGSKGEFTPEELIVQIENNTEVGKKFVEIEKEFLQALKEGILT